MSNNSLDIGLSLIYNLHVMFVFWILLPYLVNLCCPVCQRDSAALIMSEERCPLSPDITSVKSLSTQTNLHHVSYILSHTHSQLLPRKHVAAKHFIFSTALLLVLVNLAATSTQNLQYHCDWADKENLYWRIQYPQKGSLFIVQKNLSLCESIMHHCRCRNSYSSVLHCSTAATDS